MPNCIYLGLPVGDGLPIDNAAARQRTEVTIVGLVQTIQLKAVERPDVIGQRVRCRKARRKQNVVEIVR